MHCEFKCTINAFQDESWDLLNFICCEGSFITLRSYLIYEVNFPIENSKHELIFIHKYDLQCQR